MFSSSTLYEIQLKRGLVRLPDLIKASFRPFPSLFFKFCYRGLRTDFLPKALAYFFSVLCFFLGREWRLYLRRETKNPTWSWDSADDGRSYPGGLAGKKSLALLLRALFAVQFSKCVQSTPIKVRNTRLPVKRLFHNAFYLRISKHPQKLCSFIQLLSDNRNHLTCWCFSI